MDDSVETSIRTAAHEVLAEGPIRLDGLVERLTAAGLLVDLVQEVLDAVAQDGDVLGDGARDVILAELVRRIVAHSDAVWISGDELLALSTQLLDGTVFTRRLTSSEIERGVIDANPDLTVVDFGDFECLETLQGGAVAVRYRLQGEEDADAHGSYFGPPGWLSSFESDETACLRRVGQRLVIEKASELGEGEAEQMALRRAFEGRREEGLGLESLEIVLDAVCHDPSLFRSPVLPVGELLERAGLERKGAWFGLRGEDWEPPGVRYAELARDERRRDWGFEACCEEAFDSVREVWSDYLLGEPGVSAETFRSAARALVHGPVAPAFSEYLLGPIEVGSPAVGPFVDELSRLPGKLGAPGQYLLAVLSEYRGDTLEAESHLQSSMIADPEFAPARTDLAWYASDRGDAAKAASLLRGTGVSEHDSALQYFSDWADAQRPPNVGRNEPCPCGSGRKFKVCCLRKVSTVPIESRAGWVYRKLLNFAARPHRKDDVDWLLEVAGENGGSSNIDRLMSSVVDIAVMDDEKLDEFLLERGPLLPPDESDLVRSWIGSRLVLWEVVDVDPGTSLTLRDTRTGDRVVVDEHAASRTLRTGGYVLARVVAVGSENQVLGLPLNIELRLRASLIELLDSDPEAEDLAAWLGAASAPPRMTNREGEDIVLCRAVLRPVTTSWQDLENSLGAVFDEAGTGQWTERTTLEGGDSVIRCFIRRDGDELVVETNSNERFDRLLATLH